VIVVSAVSGLIALVAAGALWTHRTGLPKNKIRPVTKRRISKCQDTNKLTKIVSLKVTAAVDTENVDEQEFKLDEDFKMGCFVMKAYQKHRGELKNIGVWQVSQLFA
jgi:hypothetical protein